MRVGGRPLAVAVKVRHPGVVMRLAQDFQLLKPLAAAASCVPSLKSLSLRESLAQFSATMTAQARHSSSHQEAKHLIVYFIFICVCMRVCMRAHVCHED